MPDFPAQGAAPAPWNVLLVDDEEDVIEVSRMVLEDLTFEDRPLNILTSSSGREAREMFERHPDIALAFIDVVMETEHAGLDLVRFVRQQLGNDRTRLILRTGNPGAAPERDVVRYLEIDDYKEKTELTADRLGTAVLTSLRSYRNLLARLHFQQGLQAIIEAPPRMRSIGELPEYLAEFTSQSERMLAFVLGSGPIDGLLLQHGRSGLRAVGGLGTRASELHSASTLTIVEELRQQVFGGGKPSRPVTPTASGVLLSHESHPRESFHLWMAGDRQVSPDALKILLLFLGNRSATLGSVLLQQEVISAQTEVLHRLCETVETRSKETGLHIRRIALYSRELAHLAGLDDDMQRLIEVASPMHDIGKVAIPDHILNKPGKLDADEWAVMQTHAMHGYTLLTHPELGVLEAAAEIARSHHEKWDGNGYPRGLRGSDIPIMGRIVALVDVFDALLSRRAYKDPWPIERVLEEIARLRGSHFDPALTDLLLAHAAVFHQIFVAHPDGD